MKKKVLGIALIAMSVITFSAVAQNNVTKTTENKECCKDKDCDKANKGRKEGNRKMDFFKGINLTDAQKSQIKQLDENRKAQFAEQRKNFKKGEKPDFAKMNEQRQAEKRAYFQNIKNIIGADNYVIFLENIAVEQGQGPRGPKAFKDGKGMKHDKKGDFKKGANKDGKAQRDGKNAKDKKDKKKS